MIEVRVCDFGLAHVGNASKAMRMLGDKKDLDREAVMRAAVRALLRGKTLLLKLLLLWNCELRQDFLLTDPPCSYYYYSYFAPSSTYASFLRSASAQVGSRIFASPEILQKKEYTKAVDYWGVGLILYMTLCGKKPFETVEDILEGVLLLNSAAWAPVSEDAKALVASLLKAVPGKRLTMDQVLGHAWMNQAPVEQVYDLTAEAAAKRPGSVAKVPAKAFHRAHSKKISKMFRL